MNGRPHTGADHSGESERILIVEADPHYADLVARILSPKFGFGEVLKARTLAGALDQLHESRFALVLLDLNLPDTRGLQTLQTIQSTAPEPHILVMAGEFDEGLALQAMRCGAQDYLTKGHLGPDALRRVVRYSLERFHAAQSLNRTRSLLSTTLDALPACVGLLSAEGRLEMVNARWRSYSEPANPLLHHCEPGIDYLWVLQEAFILDEAMRAVIHGTRDQASLDYQIQTARGEAWFELTLTRFSSADERYLVISHSDISERKAMEVRLRGSEELFYQISQNVVDLMAIIDESGRRIYTSPSYFRQLGYTNMEMLGFSSHDLLHPDDLQVVEEALHRLFEEGSSSGLKYRLRRKDGSFRNYESNGAVIGDLGVGARKALIIARDYSERLEAEEERQRMEVQLRHAQKLEAIGQLSAGIAHEINTPIQYVGDNTAFLRDATEDMLAFLDRCREQVQHGALYGTAVPELRREFASLDFDYLKVEIPKAIQQSLEGVARVSKIVSAMKDFSHPGGASLERVNLNRAIESTITVSRNVWKYCAQLETDLDPGLPQVPCYPGEFNQVVLNLLVNAAHAIEELQAKKGIREPGIIRVTTQAQGQQVMVTVADTGIGIPEQILGRIFDPFFTTKPVGKGTGQGLSLAQAVIVQKHHGRLEVDSKPGQGSTFRIYLPLQELP